MAIVNNLFEELATNDKLELVRALLESLDNKVSLNDENRIRVSTKPGTYPIESQDITANAQTFFTNVDTVSNIMISCTASPTVAGHNVSFEGSLDSTDGVDGTWFSIQGVRSNANTIATSTGTLTGNPGYAYELSVNACKWFRLRTTAHTSGTMKWFIQKGSYATEPIPANQVTSVTATSSNRSAGTWYTETTTNLANGATFTGTARAIGSTTAQYFNTFRVRIFSSHSGTLTIECGRDTLNYKSLPEHTNIAILANTVTMIDVPVIGYYARCKFTNGGGATTTSIEILSSLVEK